MESKKLYYPIGEVAEVFNLPVTTIRFWEKTFDVLKPKKNKKGDRFFTNEDIENLKLIYKLVKEEGYTLAGAKVQLKEIKKNVSETDTIKKILLLVRKQLEDLKEEM